MFSLMHDCNYQFIGFKLSGSSIFLPISNSKRVPFWKERYLVNYFNTRVDKHKGLPRHEWMNEWKKTAAAANEAEELGLKRTWLTQSARILWNCHPLSWYKIKMPLFVFFLNSQISCLFPQQMALLGFFPTALCRCRDSNSCQWSCTVTRDPLKDPLPTELPRRGLYLMS